MHTLLRISDRYEEAQDIVTAAGESIVGMMETFGIYLVHMVRQYRTMKVKISLLLYDYIVKGESNKVFSVGA